MFDDLQGKRVVITGASTGIGASAAVAFAKAGCNVVIHYNRNEQEAAAVKAAADQFGVKAHLINANLSVSGAAKAVIDNALDKLGGIDVLVNNAGSLVRRAPLAEIDDALFDETMNLNVRAVLAMVQAALPSMKQRASGSIINVGSIAGSTGGGPGSAHYSVAKAAVHNLTRHMATDLAPLGIRVNAIAPGVIATPFHDATPPDRMEIMKKAVAMGRVGTPSDCVGPLLFFASNEASGYVTGQILHVNGGQYMP